MLRRMGGGVRGKGCSGCSGTAVARTSLRAPRTVKERRFCAIFIFKRSFYQDGLGTNMGKVKKSVVSLGLAWNTSAPPQVAGWCQGSDWSNGTAAPAVFSRRERPQMVLDAQVRKRVFGDAFLIENVLKLNICQDRFGTSIGKVETAASLQGKPTHLSTAVMESEGNGITWTAISPLSGKSA